MSTYTKRISVIQDDLKNSDKSTVQLALDALNKIVTENIESKKRIDQELSDEILKLAKENPKIRLGVTSRLRDLESKSLDVKQLVVQIDKMPSINSTIRMTTRVAFSLSALLGGLSIWFSWKEGLITSIILLSSTLLVSIIYVILKIKSDETYEKKY